MAAIADAFLALVSFLIEMLALSIEAIFRMLRAIGSRRRREELLTQWRNPRERWKFAAGVCVLLPVFYVGFGIGLPLAIGVAKGWLADEPKTPLKLEGIAEFEMPEPKRPGKSLTVRVDRSRLHELKDTSELVDLAAKFEEIAKITRD